MLYDIIYVMLFMFSHVESYNRNGYVCFMLNHVLIYGASTIVVFSVYI